MLPLNDVLSNKKDSVEAAYSILCHLYDILKILFHFSKFAIHYLLIYFCLIETMKRNYFAGGGICFQQMRQQR